MAGHGPMGVRIVLVGMSLLAALGAGRSGRVQDVAPERPSGVDAAQAYRMLDFLAAVARGDSAGELVDAVMAAEGTRLIVGQMNLVRTVSMEQYREVLSAVAEGREPALEPVDSSRRAGRGVDGLLRDVWPGLRWGVGHVEVLRQRVRHLTGVSFYRRARSSALRFLPDSLRTVPRVFVVLGGRAGGATLGPDQIYVDVLVYSYRGRRSGGFPDDDRIIRTVAHEMHHVGYGPYLHRLGDSLQLGGADRFLFGLVANLMTEGAATYLISEQRDMDRMKQVDPYRSYLSDPGALVATVDSLMNAVIKGQIRTPQAYDDATADLVGSWYHSAGSHLLAVIDEACGEEGVRAVVADPRLVPAAYNRAVRSLARPEFAPFNPTTANALQRLGLGDGDPAGPVPRCD